MDSVEVGRYWDANAPVWTRLVRMGCDVYRDHFNTPAFLEMLPEVDGRTGLDIGCGEGYNTRKVAELGARMVGIDIAPTFIKHAREVDSPEPLGIDYQVADGCSLPFALEAFDFVVAFMCLMDIPDQERVFAKVYRVLRHGGFFQFSITHPCTDTPYRRWVEDESGRRVALACGGYFHETEGEIVEWMFSQTPPEL
ncbi:class I SAM-dependent methyltransferase, partial [bacterium]|nr:class I SAM-dependent methyltransferase [bacterium]